MIVRTDFQQGSAEWYAARLGIPTSSNFDKIITPAKGDFSKSARGYAMYLVAETMLGQTLESLDHIEWIARGKELEPQAARVYQALNDLDDADMRAVGFVTTDDGMVGASPDRLVLDGGLEIKCPAPHTHIGYLLDGPNDAYRPQVQGQLYVAELEWVDFFSWHPAMPPARVRFYRDEPYIQKLQSALVEFTDLRLSLLARARASGHFDTHETVSTPLETFAQELIHEFHSREKAQAG
jgi:hypothetical protein